MKQIEFVPIEERTMNDKLVAARTIHPARKSNADFDAYTKALIDDILKHI